MRDEGARALFADLGQAFGLSRPAALCFAAIWRAPQPPCADDLVETAEISRSNVSTALKELRSWGLVAISRLPGDRREYFTAPADPWLLARQMLAERERRVLAPALDRLRALQAIAPDPGLADLGAVLRALSAWQAGLARLDPGDLAAAVTHLPQPEEPGRKKKKKARKG